MAMQKLPDFFNTSNSEISVFEVSILCCFLYILWNSRFMDGSWSKIRFSSELSATETLRILLLLLLLVELLLAWLEVSVALGVTVDADAVVSGTKR